VALASTQIPIPLGGLGLYSNPYTSGTVLVPRKYAAGAKSIFAPPKILYADYEIFCQKIITFIHFAIKITLITSVSSFGNDNEMKY